MAHRICVVSYRDMKHPEAGGAEVIIEEVFGRIADQGHDVTLLTGGFKGGAQRDRIGNLEIHRTGNQFTFNFAAPLYFKKHLAKRDFDLVAEDINKIPFFMPIHSKVPVLAIVPHLFGTTVFEQASWPIGAYVYLYERLIPRVYRRSMFSVLSGTTRDDLIARGIPERNLRLIHSGMDHELYKPSAVPVRDRPKRIVYLGRLKKYKCIEYPILALPKILETVPDAEYWVVGEGDYKDDLRRIAERTGVADHVRFPGFVGGKDKVALLQESRVLAYTSPKEGWGLSVIEAGACATPVVASDAPGLRESVVDAKTGFLVDHGDIPALAKQITRLLTDDALAESMAEEGVKWAAGFKWENSTRKTIELIDEIVDRQARTSGPTAEVRS